jgi:hypothetical protein
MRRWSRLAVASICIILSAGLLLSASPAPAKAEECVTFTETGQQVCGQFLDYWRAHGGLAQQGLPLTDSFTEISPTNNQPYTVQYFERARFEYHPENQPPFQVLLGLLGAEQYKAMYPTTPPPPFPGDPFNDPALPQECATLGEGGYQVCSVFLTYWREHGGPAQQGLPLTGVIFKTNPTDGKFYPTQYFERARFEYHEANQPPYNVLLGLLGREQLLAKYPNGVPSGITPSPASAKYQAVGTGANATPPGRYCDDY